MENRLINIVISPEVLKDDILEESYNGFDFGVYSGFSSILSGGTNGASLLTGLTIPLLLTQTYNDIGFYDEFEGFIAQTDVVTNFVTSGNSLYPYQITLYNSSSYNFSTFLEQSNYMVDWGDGSMTSYLSLTNPILTHNYNTVPSDYTITLTQTNAFGNTEIKKQVFLPLTGVTIDNQLGEVTFIQQGGSWSGIPISYDYIFTADSSTNINQQVSSNFTQLPVVVSGYTTSRLNLLRRWGPQSFSIGFVLQINNGSLGQVDEITNEYTAYTINNIHYVDLKNKKTIFYVNSSGITSTDFVVSALTKNEAMLDFVLDPEIQSDIYVERGKYSPNEQIQRLGEVDNIGDLQRYGYGYFKFFGG